MAILDRSVGLKKSSNGELTVDQLLEVARLQGGSVAEVAEELSHPNRSILSTVGHGFTKAFTNFLDIIATPGHIVAGALSPDNTISEAMKKNITVSDVVFGSKDSRDLTTFQKVGDFSARLAVDVLTDPLTYVTFGATRGVFGLSAAPKYLKSGDEVLSGYKAFLQKQGLDDSTKLAKNGLDEYGEKVYLTKEAEALADRHLQAQREGLRHTFLLDERKKLIDAGRSADEADLLIKDLDKRTNDFMIENALNTRLSKSYAVNAVGRLIERNPALVETLVDKGGIKLFGKSVLSSQRISRTMQFIPGMTAIDHLSQGARNTLGALFSPNYTTEGRLPQELIDLRQKYKDLADSMNNELILNATNYFEKLGINQNEAAFITAAIEHGIRPRDPKAADLWQAVHGIQPESGLIRDEVWQAMGFTQKQLKTNLKMLREAGIPVGNYEKYFPHILVKQMVAKGSFKTPLKTKTVSNKMAMVSKLVGKDGKELLVKLNSKPGVDGRVTAQVLRDGKEVTENFIVINSTKEIKKIEAIAAKRSKEIGRELRAVGNRLKKSAETVSGKVAKDITDEIAKLLDDAGLNANDKNIIAKSIKRLVEPSDVSKIVGERVRTAYKNGVKFSDGSGISAKDLDKVIEKASRARSEGEDLSGTINKLLTKDINIKESATAAKKSVDKEVSKLAKEIQERARQARQAAFDEGLDEKSLRNLITQMVARMASNPQGLRRVLDKIISDKALVDDLSRELEDIARAVDLDRKELTEMGGMFISEGGTAYNRARASVQEARQLGVDFEENSMIALLIRSMESIKVATGRDFMQEVAMKMGVRSSEAGDGWRALGTTGLEHQGIDVSRGLRTPDGEEIFFHPLVAKQIEEFGSSLAADEAINVVARNYDKLQNLFKASVTAIFPAFHGRNAISNVMLNFLDIGYHALRPEINVASASLLNTNAKLNRLAQRIAKGDIKASEEYTNIMSKVFIKDKLGREWTTAEIISLVKKNVVGFNPRNLGQIDQVQFGRSTVDEIKEHLYPSTRTEKLKAKVQPINPLSTNNALIKKGFQVGQIVEDHARVVNFLANLKGTGDPQLAAQRVKMFLFDYQNLSSFERKFLRRIIPFYTFSRKNLELQTKTLFTRPGAIAGEIRAIQTIGDALSGEGLTDEERAGLPQWMQQGINTVLGRNGSSVTLLNSLSSPIEQPFQQFQPNQLLSSVSPILRVVPELMADYSAYYGKPISDVTDASSYKHAPAAIKKLIGYTEVTVPNKKTGETIEFSVAMRPQNMHIINNLPASGRLFNTLESMTNKDFTTQQKMLAGLLGYRIYEKDLEYEAAQREKENREELEKLLERSKAGYNFSKFTLSEEYRD